MLIPFVTLNKCITHQLFSPKHLYYIFRGILIRNFTLYVNHYVTTNREILDNCSTNSIVKSISSVSQKSKFCRRAVSRFLYTMHNQCGVFYLFYWHCELKILRVSVKLPYPGIYFTETHARWRLTRVLLRLQHFSCFSNFRGDRCKNY